MVVVVLTKDEVERANNLGLFDHLKKDVKKLVTGMKVRSFGVREGAHRLEAVKRLRRGERVPCNEEEERGMEEEEEGVEETKGQGGEEVEGVQEEEKEVEETRVEDRAKLDVMAADFMIPVMVNKRVGKFGELIESFSTNESNETLVGMSGGTVMRYVSGVSR